MNPLVLVVPSFTGRETEAETWQRWGSRCCGPGCSKDRLNWELSGLVQARLILPWGIGKDEVSSSCPFQSCFQWFEDPPSHFRNKALPLVTHKFLLVFLFMSYW